MPEVEVIAEALCDAVEEIPWRKVVERVRGTSDTQQPVTRDESSEGVSSTVTWQDKTGDRPVSPERIALP